MRSAMILGLLLLAGCNASERKADALIEADLARGEALIKCRDSSSGVCHALFVTDAQLVRAEVKKGEGGSASGLGQETRYCVDAIAPDPGKCRMSRLLNGEQIVRNASIKGN